MQFLTILIIGILEGAEVDLFIPSFPELQSAFGLSPFMVQLTLGVNLAAQCIASLIVGNLGDRYGRKPIILIGLFIFIIGSFMCIFADAYWQLLLGRFLQGIGISGPAVLSYLVIADMYSTERQQQLMGVLNGSITLGMAFAPVVGSYVSLFFKWQGNFILLLMLGLLCAGLCILYIPKGKPHPSMTISLKEYIPVLTSKKAIYYIITICLLLQSYWIFIGMAPILYMESLGVPLSEFGFYQGAMAGVFSVASFAMGFFLRKYGQKACFFFGMGMFAAFILATLLLMIGRVQSPLVITIVMQFLAIGTILAVNILWPLSLQTVADAKGRIAAILVSSRLIATAASLQIVSYFYQGTFVPIGISMCLTLILGLWFCYKLLQEDKFFIA
jgi:DHA1 family bicyclomycin/chloramphenicol resistance-like MFS transporter